MWAAGSSRSSRRTWPRSLPRAAGPGDLARTAAPGDLAGTAVSGDGVRQAPVEDLQLPLRAFNSLRREGIHTIGDLSARNEADLLTIANLGPQSIKEIKQRLAERGLGLASAAPEAGPAAGADGEIAAAACPPATPTPVTAVPTPATPTPVTPLVTPPQAARPPDEDAIDLLSVA